MIINKSPCYDVETHTDCPNRCVGCAGNCEKWAAYQKYKKDAFKSRIGQSIANSIIKERVVSHKVNRAKREQRMKRIKR